MTIVVQGEETLSKGHKMMAEYVKGPLGNATVQ